jgi:hypothetical protein
VEEIQAYKERPPILATIELVDGTPLTEDLPITPDLNVAKVLDICTHFLELQDARMQYFGVFVEDVDDPSAPQVSPDSEDAPPYAGLDKTPRPLQNENFMGDVVTIKVRQNQPFKFVFKRKIFLKNLDGASEDPMFERLVYLQAVDEVMKGNIPVDTEEDVALLAAQALACDLGDQFPDNEDELAAADLIEYIPEPWKAAMDVSVSRGSGGGGGGERQGRRREGQRGGVRERVVVGNRGQDTETARASAVLPGLQQSGADAAGVWVHEHGEGAGTHPLRP